MNNEIPRRLPTDDLFKKSYGVGHHYRPGYYFPDPSFQSQLTSKLPDELNVGTAVPVSDKYATTYGDYHDLKVPSENLTVDPLYKKAPAHWNIHFNRDTWEKLQNRGYRRPLSPSHQVSEMKDKYQNKAPIVEPERWWNKFQPFNLDNHHTEGPSKKIIATTKNAPIAGRTLYPKDEELVREMDSYLTTNMKYHRIWRPDEWKGIGKKDVPTYWDCEGYKKVWGHGLKYPPVPKDAIPRENLPMRDNMIFKHAAKQNYVRPLNAVVPNTGLKSTYQHAFIEQTDKYRKMAISPCLDAPFYLPRPGLRTAYAAPGMYDTEYCNIGSDKPVMVGTIDVIADK